jgi:hypothetical protein
MRTNPKKYKKLLAFVLIQIGLLFVLGGIKLPQALAADPGSGAAAAEAPQINSARYNTSIVSNPDSGTQVTPYFDIGNNTSNFNYQAMFMNVYVSKTKTGSFTIKITNAAPDCYSASGGGVVGPDYSESGGAPWVQYTLLKAGDVPIPGAAGFSGTIKGGGCGTTVTLAVPNLANNAPYPMVGVTANYDGYYVLKAAIVAGGGQGENSFRTAVGSPGFPPAIGYVGGSSKVAGMGFRDNNLESPGHYWNGWLAFGTVNACSDLNNPNDTLSGTVSWQDLDLNRTDWNPNPAPSMALYQQRINNNGTVGSAWSIVEQYNGYQLRNNGMENGSFSTTNFKVGYRYKIVMANFGVRNTVRLNLDGQIRGIGSNLAERPTTAKCFASTCSITAQPGRPPDYTKGQSIQLHIIAKNVPTPSNYAGTWQKGTEMLLRTKPSAKPFSLSNPVGPGGSANFTDTISVPSIQQTFTYRMYTNSGVTPMTGSGCSIQIGPGPISNNSGDGWLDVSCGYTYIRGINSTAKWHPGGQVTGVNITKVPVQIVVTSLDDPDRGLTNSANPYRTYVTNGGDSGPISTFSIMGGMWPHGSYQLDLYVEGAAASFDSLTYNDDGSWANGSGTTWYGVKQTGSQDIGDCMRAECSSFTQPDVEPGQTVRLNGGIQFNNQTRETYTTDNKNGYWMHADTSGGISASPSDPIGTTGSIGPAGTYTISASFDARVDYTGRYSVALMFKNDSSPLDIGEDIPCESEDITPATKPFLQVWGGDINSGGGFEKLDASGAYSCGNDYPDYVSPSSPSTGGDPNYGGIKTFGYTDAAGSHGSLSDFGALSLGLIARNSGAKIDFGAQPKFSNTSTPYSGQLNSIKPDYCLTDFFSSTRKTPAPRALSTPPTQISDLSGSLTGQYIVNGQNINDFKGGQVDSNKKITLYVDGDIRISGNITYDNWDPNNVDSAPSFTIVARGNINIAPSVTRIDGLYIAQPSSPGKDGEFNTCADNTGNQFCTDQFVANGAVIARLILPLRSVGTVSPDANPAFSPAPGHRPAEIFNFIPAMAITAPNFSPTYNPLQGLFSLPPVF